MFVNKIDWKNPQFFQWNLCHLGELNQTQRNAFFDNEDVDFPDFSVSERIDLCKKVSCHVDLFHSNVCTGVERAWPKKMFKKANFNELNENEKYKMYRKMEEKAVLLHNNYVNEDRLKIRRKRRTNRALAPYYEERRLRNFYNRIKSLGVESRIIYECSENDDDSEDEPEELNRNDDITSESLSILATPEKDLKQFTTIDTQIIDQLRKMQSNIIFIPDNTIEADQIIALNIEIESETPNEIQESIEHDNLSRDFELIPVTSTSTSKSTSSPESIDNNNVNGDDEESGRPFAIPTTGSSKKKMQPRSLIDIFNSLSPK